jgi:predicted type IV restriction endonuclease
MRDTLVDIRKKLQSGVFQNEEHVRLSLVARILNKLGWDIWNPTEVNTEFAPVRTEDNTRVDFALFLHSQEPSLFIEVKAVGKMGDLRKAEEQMRDYNRNNTAPISVLTDGATWRFYYSRTGGEFASKLFRTIELLKAELDLDDALQAFSTFLGKAEIENGSAQEQAEAFLKLGRKQRAMEQALPEARRLIQDIPYPSLPQALVTATAKQAAGITEEEAKDFLARRPALPSSEPPSGIKVDGQKPRRPIDGSTFDPYQPPDLRFTSVISASLGDAHVRDWNPLVHAGVGVALKQQFSVDQIRQTGCAIEEGPVTERGFHPIPGTHVSVQGMEANRAWRCAFALARMLNRDISVEFRWPEREGAAHPGQIGALHWAPNG